MSWLDQIDRKLLDLLQTGIPMSSKPYASIAEFLGIKELQLPKRVKSLKRQGVIKRICTVCNPDVLGYISMLVALEVSPSYLKEVALHINTHSGVTHNYERDHTYNLWFTLILPPRKGILKVPLLPPLKVYKIGFILDMTCVE